MDLIGLEEIGAKLDNAVALRWQTPEQIYHTPVSQVLV